MFVSVEEDKVGIFTQAISSSFPVKLSYFSISWFSLVMPSDDVNSMSSPFDRALAKTGLAGSVIFISTGKLVWSAGVIVLLMVICCLYSQLVSYQSAAKTVEARLNKNKLISTKNIAFCNSLAPLPPSAQGGSASGGNPSESSRTDLPPEEGEYL